MNSPEVWIFAASACFLWASAVVMYVRINPATIFEWKGLSRVLAVFFVSLGIIAAGYAQRFSDLSAPVVTVLGTVEFLQAYRGASSLRFRTATGETLHLRAPDTLALPHGDQLDIHYISATGEIISVRRVTDSAAASSLYENKRSLGLPFFGVALMVFILGCAPFNLEMMRGRGTIGDTVADKFTPDDLPGEHWKFVESENGKTRFATEEEKERMKRERM